MIIEKKLNIELTEEEYTAIKKVLANISDVEYKDKFSLEKEEMYTMHELYEKIPDKE